MRDLPAGTVTFLFTDIEGSTRLLHELGPEAYAAALQEHRRAVRDAFERHGGIEVDTQGDSFFVAFPTAPGAAAAAAEAQAALAAGPIRARMGLHTGTPQLADGDYVGMDVHTGARIAGVAHGGQVLLSQSTRELIAAEVFDLGLHRLKDLSAPARLFQLGPGDFPPLRSLSQTNLPVQATPFVGREKELAEVLGLARREDVRLLTLTGAGGSGKTRLALQAAALLADASDHGVWWVPLAPLHDESLVIEAAAHAIGASGDLTEHLGDRRLLVLFDNFEHVLGAGPELAGLLAGCPNLTLLVTSREPLHLSGEQEYPVPPFAHAEGMGFFVSRARAARPGFEPDAAVEEICRRVDDLPLALELAAARVKTLSSRQILERLEQRLQLLTGGALDLPERQRTLRQTIAWSHDLLDGREQALFRRLAVFAGGWSLDAAETVCETDLETVGSLVDKSLVRVDAERYAFLETIREFAAERLVESGEVELVRRRQAAHYLALAEELEPKLFGSDQATSLDLLETEHDNLRQALAWFAGQPEHELELRLAVALGRFRYVRGYLVEGRDGIEHALERGRNSVPVQLRAKALRAESTFAIIQGEYVEARKLARAGLDLSRAAGDDPGVIRSLSNLGAILDGLGEIDAAVEAHEEAVSLSRQQGDSRSVALAVNNLGDALMSAGDYERAAGLFEESLALLRELGDSANVARALYNAAVAAIGLGEGAPAAERLRESLPLSLEIGDREDAIWCLIAFAALAARDASYEHATRLLATVEARLEEFGGSMKPFERGLYDRTLAATRDALPAETFAAAWSEGSDLSLDEAAESAMNRA